MGMFWMASAKPTPMPAMSVWPTTSVLMDTCEASQPQSTRLATLEAP